MTQQVLTFAFNNRPLRITHLKDSQDTYFFSHDIKLLLTESLKSLPKELSKAMIEGFFDNFTKNGDKKSCFFEGKIYPVVSWFSIIELFQALNNFDEEEMEEAFSFRHVADDIEELQDFLIDSHSKTVRSFGIDPMIAIIETLKRCKGGK